MDAPSERPSSSWFTYSRLCTRTTDGQECAFGCRASHLSSRCWCFFKIHALSAVAAGLCIVLTSTAYAQNVAGPQPVAVPPGLPAPLGQPYVGKISLSINLTNVNARLLTVQKKIPVTPGASSHQPRYGPSSDITDFLEHAELITLL